jgi:hypothetical protein
MQMAGTAFAMVGVSFLWMTVSSVREDLRRIRTWRAVEATIVDSWVSEQRTTATTGARLTRTEYVPEVLLRYWFGGAQYESSMSELGRSLDRSVVERRLPALIGQTRPVFVNPERPTETAKDVGWNVRTWAGSAIMAVFGVIQLVAGVVMLRLAA